MPSKPPRTDGAVARAPEEKDPVLAALLAAPIDEEPFTDEERAAFDAAVEDYRTSRVPMRLGADVHALMEQTRYDAAE